MTHTDPRRDRTIVTAEKIYVSSRAKPVEALVIEDGRVVAAGSRRDLADDAATRLLDFGARTILPGLVDTHPHLLHFSVRASGFVDLSDARDHDDIVARIRKKAQETPAGTWIQTTPVGEAHYFIRRSWRDLPERCLPSRDVLDRATTEHPVHIQAYAPELPNVCAFNSKALELLGLSDASPDRVGDVEIDKDDDGRVTGRLRGAVTNYYSFDPYWIQLKMRMTTPAPDVDGAVTAAMTRYNSLGVTTVYEAHNMTAADIAAYRKLRQEARLSVRVMAAMEVESYAVPPRKPKSLAEFEASLNLAKSLNTSDDDDYFRVRGATLSEGGPGWSGHQRMREPYKDPFGRPTKGTRFQSPDKLRRFISFCACEQMRGNFVVGGYSDHDDVIGALETAEPEYRISERRWLMQHCMLVTPDHVRRMKKLNLDVTTSMSFSWAKGDIYEERMGRHVLRDLIPIKRLLDAGLSVGCGSDWGPKNIFEHIALAQTHQFAGSGRRNDTPDHVLSRRESIERWTDAAAEVIQWRDVGKLIPGSFADFIVLDHDPFECPTESLPSLAVQQTYLGGKLVYNREA